MSHTFFPLFCFAVMKLSRLKMPALFSKCIRFGCHYRQSRIEFFCPQLFFGKAGETAGETEIVPSATGAPFFLRPVIRERRLVPSLLALTHKPEALFTARLELRSRAASALGQGSSLHFVQVVFINIEIPRRLVSAFTSVVRNNVPGPRVVASLLLAAVIRNGAPRSIPALEAAHPIVRGHAPVTIAVVGPLVQGIVAICVRYQIIPVICVGTDSSEQACEDCSETHA